MQTAAERCARLFIPDFRLLFVLEKYRSRLHRNRKYTQRRRRQRHKCTPEFNNRAQPRQSGTGN